MVGGKKIEIKSLRSPAKQVSKQSIFHERLGGSPGSSTAKLEKLKDKRIRADDIKRMIVDSQRLIEETNWHGYYYGSRKGQGIGIQTEETPRKTGVLNHSISEKIKSQVKKSQPSELSEQLKIQPLKVQLDLRNNSAKKIESSNSQNSPNKIFRFDKFPERANNSSKAFFSIKPVLALNKSPKQDRKIKLNLFSPSQPGLSNSKKPVLQSPSKKVINNPKLLDVEKLKTINKAIKFIPNNDSSFEASFLREQSDSCQNIKQQIESAYIKSSFREKAKSSNFKKINANGAMLSEMVGPVVRDIDQSLNRNIKQSLFDVNEKVNHVDYMFGQFFSIPILLKHRKKSADDILLDAQK